MKLGMLLELLNKNDRAGIHSATFHCQGFHESCRNVCKRGGGVMYKAEKKEISVSGMASLGWFLGRGYVRERLTVKCEKWCVTKDGEAKPICICHGKNHAEAIASAMNASCDGLV